MKKKIFLFIISIFNIIMVINYTVKADVKPSHNVVNNGFYYIRNATTNLYLQDYNLNVSYNANAIQTTYCDGDRQIFKFLEIYTGKYEIYSQYDTTKCLCVPSNSSANGVIIGFEDIDLTHPTNHRFQLVDTGDGDHSFYIKTASSYFNKYVTVEYGDTYSGAYIVQKNFNAGDYNKWYLEGIDLNEMKKISLFVGETRTFKYTIPDDKLFSIQTFKYYYESVDTVLTVSNLVEGTISDDDGGTGYYSLIDLCNQGSRTIDITVSLHPSSSSGHFYLQIRRQQAVLYGFEYDDGLNTIPDLTAPYNELNVFFQTYKYESQVVSHFCSNDDRSIQRCDSEVVFFTGHGYSNGSALFLGDIGDNTTRSFYETSTIPILHTTKIAIWSSCNSSKINADNTSLILKCVEKGAKSSLGFPTTIYSPTPKIFTDKLFMYLCQGETIQDAASHAVNYIIFPWDPVKNYEIAGSNYTTIVNANSRVTNSSIANKQLINEYHDLLARGDYTAYENKDGSIRYYFCINGIITSIFVDVLKNNDGNIIEIRGNLDSLNEEQLTVLPIKVSYESNDGHIFYYIANNMATPILFETINDVDSQQTYNYIKCLNLYSNEEIDYEQVGIWED